MADWCWIIKGGGAQTKHKATGISSRLRDIDLVLMPTNIDGLHSGGAQIEGWVSLRVNALYFQIWRLWCRSTLKRAVNQKSVLLQFHSDILLATSNACWLWVALPASRGVGVLPCLHTNRHQSRHRGAKDLWSVEQKERESPLKEWLSSFLSVSLSLSITLVMMMRSNQQHRTHWIIEESSELNCMPHKRGFVFSAYKQAAHQKYSFKSFIHTSTRRPCLVALPVWSCVCVMLYLSSCVGKIVSLPRKTGEQSSMGAMQVTPWENVRLHGARLPCPWIPAFLSRPPTLPQSQFNPVITQYIRPKPGNDTQQRKGPLNKPGNCSLPWPSLALLSLHEGIMV